MTRTALFWSFLYLLLVAAPLLLLFAVAPDGIAPGWDLSLAFGFSGIAIMGLQFALTSRFRRATAPFGVDIIYYFHRLVALVGMLLLLAHFAIIRVGWPEALGPLNPFEAPGYTTAGRAALLLFLIIIVTSLWRKQLRIEYRLWRIGHALMATLAFVLAVVHIEGAGYYSRAPEVRWLWLGYTVFWVLLIVHIRLLRPWAITRRPWRIAEVRPERGRATTLVLEPVGHPGMRFAPGQFAWMTLDGSPYRFNEHPFSFSGSATRDDGRVEFTIKALGDFTATLAERRPGAPAWIDGPYGAFIMDRHDKAVGHCFIAGGIGIVPIMSMLRTLADRGETRPLWLFNADSRWEDVTFREELLQLPQRLPNLTLTMAIDEAIEEKIPGVAFKHGRIDRELMTRTLPANRQELNYWLCGPKPLVVAVIAILRELGVPMRRIHYELFDMV